MLACAIDWGCWPPHGTDKQPGLLHQHKHPFGGQMVDGDRGSCLHHDSKADCRRAARRSSLEASRPDADATGQAAKISLDGTESLYHSKVRRLLCRTL